MAHEETRRILPGAKTAVLMMHGICGTPDHFRAVLPLEDLVPDSWSLCNVIMPGHGGRVEDFSRSSMAAWEGYCMELFDQLCQAHVRVYLVGHSMGTLFAIRMACKRPEKVAGMLLMQVPLRVGVKLFGVCNVVRYGFSCIDPNDPLQVSLAKACSIPATKMVHKYIGWLPRMAELVRYMHQTVQLLPGLAVPVVAYQSKRDEMVSVRSQRLLERCGKVQVHQLIESTHFYYNPEEIEIIRKTMADLLQ